MMAFLRQVGATAVHSNQPASQRRRRDWLWAARLGLIVITVLAVLLIAAAIPTRLDQIVSAADERALRDLGISTSAFAGYLVGLNLIVGLAHILIAAVIVWRRSDEAMALFAALALVTNGANLPLALLHQPGSVPPALVGPVNGMLYLGLTASLMLLFVFPDGRFVPPWTRLLAIAWVALGLGVVFLNTWPVLIQALALLIWSGAGVYAQMFRYRHVSSPVQRQQTKWALIGLAAAVAVPIIVLADIGATGGNPALPNILAQRVDDSFFAASLLARLAGLTFIRLGTILFPLSFAIAILRYRLWEIDVIFNRTLVYGALTAILAALYFGCVMALQQIFGATTGHTSPLVIAASTLAMAALFNPLRRRVQDWINRRFYRGRYDIAQQLAIFSATLRDEVDLPRLVERLEGVIWETIQPAYAVTWLRGRTGFSVCQPDAGARPEMEISLSDPLVEHVRRAAGVVEIDRLALDSPATRRIRAGGVKLIVPLVSQGEFVGWLSLGPRLSEQGYSADDRALLTNLAGQVAPAMRVAQLARAQQAEALERERVNQEMRVARLIQQTLLPREVPDLPGWQVAVYWQPARAVGGDFYDFMPRRDGRWVVIVGDVADKGVPAAIIMATTRAILRGAARRMLSPGEALARANELLCPETPQHMFVTCLYAILDPATGHLQYANAGHNLPYYYRHGEVTELRATGMPLGLMPGMDYEEQTAIIEPGGSLLLYSDGLVEAHDARREMFGFSRLQRLLKQPAASGSSLIDYLLAELAAFSGESREQEDDVTLLTLERAPHPAGGAEWQTLAEFHFSSEPGNERLMAEQATAALAGVELSPQRLERLKTAVAEATMNAIEHGNHNRPEVGVSIHVLASETAVAVRITDHGGRQPIPQPETPDLMKKLAGLQTPRGWGLYLIDRLVDEVRHVGDGDRHTIELIMNINA